MGLGGYSLHTMWCMGLGTWDSGTNPVTGVNVASNTTNFGHLAWAGTANEIMADKDDAVSTTGVSTFSTNSCWTVAMPFLDSTDANGRILAGGFTGSCTNCLDHAVDGFTVWGVPLVYKIGDDWTATVIKLAATATLTVEKNRMGN